MLAALGFAVHGGSAAPAGNDVAGGASGTSKKEVTGIRVTTRQQGLSLWVDGNASGSLPQDFTALSPGEHTLRIAADEHYAIWEERVTIRPGETLTFGPIQLQVLYGVATIIAGPGASGARVSIESPRTTSRRISLPVTLPIPTDEGFRLVATRAGYERFELPLVFEPGQAERTFEVAFPSDDTPRKNLDCQCAPGDLRCAMECARSGGDRSRDRLPLDGTAIRQVVAKGAPSVRSSCWQAALARRTPDAPRGARVAVTLTISASGSVANTTTSGDPKGYPELARCIEREVLKWRFPESSGTTTASVPFVFAAP